MKYYICITPFFPSAETFDRPYVLDQVKAIARNSDYTVIVIKPTSFLHREEDYEYDGIKVFRSIDYTLPSNILPNALSDYLTYKAFLRKLKSIGINPADIEVCHAHVAALGSTAVRLKRDFPTVKTVVQHHGFDVMSETDGRLARYGWHKRLCQRHGAAICNEADLNVGVSNRTLSYVEAVPGVSLKNSYVLYNGVDTTKFYPLPSTPNTQFTIGCVANFWELKDHMTLIKATEELIKQNITDLKVIFIGTGYTRATCERYIADHGLSQYFEFKNTMHHRQLPEFYRSLDLFVLPSYWEAFGCVYTEAYACGTPFIGVKGQGIAEIVPDKDADRWLIDKGDYKSLAKLIKKSMFEGSNHQTLKMPIDIDSTITSYLKFLS